MEITKVNIFPLEETEEKKPLAVCSVVLDGLLMIHDIKIFRGDIVVMPQRKTYAEGFVRSNRHKSNDICHPIDSEFFTYFRGRVLDEYKAFLESNSQK